MVAFTRNGVAYDTDDLNSNDNRGYADLVTPGVGGSPVPLYIAMMMDSVADAGKNMVSTSTTSESVGSGSKTLTLATTLPFVAGTWILAADSSNPTTKFMLGQITSTSGADITFNVPDSDYYTGSGTVSTWNVSVSGPLGPQGATGEISVDEFQKQTDIFGTTTGSSNAYILTLSTASGAIVAGHRYCIIPNFTNTGTATIDVSGQGAEDIYYDGAPLIGGEIQSGRPMILVHDGTNFNIVSRVPERVIGTCAKAITTVVVTGDGWDYLPIPADLDGANLVFVEAFVITAGTTGTTDIQIYNVTQAVDMLTTKLTIDSGATSSAIAATPAVIDTSNDDVASGDQLRVDIDAVSTTAPIGLMVRLYFRKVA